MIRSVTLACAMLAALPAVAQEQSAPIVQIAPPPTPPHLAKAPSPIDPGGWLTARDYPKAARRAGMQGTTGFNLSVDKSGRTVGCEIVSTSGWPLLDTVTCDLLMKRARFKPAEDGWGVPIPFTYRNRFRWMLAS